MAFGRSWQRRLADGRWVGVTWPEAYGGRGAGALAHYVVQEELARARAPELVGRIGVNLVGPTLLAHGTEDQRRRWLPGILRADILFCQLFSEPGAGSDLASLATRARRSAAEDGWVLDGQKVWTSYAQFADWGLGLARTNPDVRKQAGITAFAVDMSAPGVEVRPLRQITGESDFNEVFLDGVFVPDDCVIGEVDAGWRVSGSTLAHERGTNPRQLVIHSQHLEEVLRLAADRGAFDDPHTAQRLAAGVRGGQAVPAPQLAFAVASGGGLTDRARGLGAQALLVGDEPAPSPAGARRARPGRTPGRRRVRATPARANGSARGSTTRRRRSSPAPTRSSARSSASGSWACHAEGSPA